MSTGNSSGPFGRLKNAITRHVGDQELGQLIADSIVAVEPVLLIAEKYGEGVGAHEANVLLSNARLLRTEHFGKREHYLQMARRHCRKMLSVRNWRRALKDYMDPRTDSYRMFDIEDDQIVLRSDVFGDSEQTSRADIYLDWLDSPTQRSTMPKAKADKEYTYWSEPEHESRGSDAKNTEGQHGHTCRIRIPKEALIWENASTHSAGKAIERKGVRPPIEFELSELIDAAREVSELAGEPHFASILERAAHLGLFNRIDADGAHPADRITIAQVTNLVGIVGAGKSVLSNVLTFACAKRGLRVVTVQNSISDVIDNLDLFKRLEIEAVPLASRRDRLLHLDEIASKRGEMLLDETIARYFEAECILDGMASNDDTPCGYQAMPCFNLKDSKGRRHACPFFEICPAHAMERDTKNAQVVITTPMGFAYITVGPERRPFFEYALEQFDLVIFDEADRVQAELDEKFAPAKSIQEHIRNTADYTARAAKRLPQDKLRNANDEMFIDLEAKTDQAAKALAETASRPAIAEWKQLKDRTFTSLSLLEQLQNAKEESKNDALPAELAQELEAHINLFGKRNPNDRDSPEITIGNVIDAACDDIADAHFEDLYSKYLKQKGVELDSTLRDRFAFTLKVARFDDYLRELDAASSMTTIESGSNEDLYGFLHASSSRQTSYLPSSPVGNLCGFRITEENDITLYRQFGIGRAFMTALPWLITAQDGSPLGPHTLLLSGSSYEPGCLQYHVNVPVKYLLDATSKVAEFLARSVVRDLGLETRVSGSGKMRVQNLNHVLNATVDTIISELDGETAGKVLVIVNNYEEASTARDTLQMALFNRRPLEKVCALVQTASKVQDPTRDLPRSEVYRFAQHEARILVAPAMAIERGFNIVDESGHSAIDTLIFAVRPMGIPNDLTTRFKRLIGLSCDYARKLDPSSPTFEKDMRRNAWRQWRELERDESLTLNEHVSLDDYLCRDIVSTLMVLTVQIFGRLSRIQNFERRPPHVYFADAAFAGNRDPSVQSFRTLELMQAYMRQLIENSEQPAVAKALYGPFYTALTKGTNS